MFCPKCSREQFSESASFCSGCGFRLNVVKALFFENADSSLNTSKPGAVNRARRGKDLMTGAAIMAVLALHTAWTTEDLSLDREYASLVAKCLILCVLIGVVPRVRDFFSGRAMRDGISRPKMPARLAAKFKNRNSALPAAYNIPAADYFTNPVATAELVRPPSVTEDTTNLLRHH